MELVRIIKDTRKGETPENWRIRRISSLAKIIGGGTPTTAISEYWGGSIAWVSAGDVSNAKGRFVSTTEKTITELGLATSSATIVPQGTTIIIARGATVGRMSQLIRAMAFNQTCYGLIAHDGFHKDYLYYALLYSVKLIRSFSHGTIFGTITTTSFDEWEIPVPPFSEQCAIAEVLGDADSLIESLEQLIAKNRKIKQGVMQELLTGQRRLPGFRGQWEEKCLSEIGEITGAGVDKNISAGEVPVRLVNYLDVYNKDRIFSKDLNHWVTTPRAKLTNCSVKIGDIFFTPSSEVPSDIGVSSVAMESIPDAAYSYHVVRLRPYENFDISLDFRPYMFNTNFFLDQARTICRGSGTR